MGDPAIAVATVQWLIEHCEREKAVLVIAGWLDGVISEQLRRIIDDAIAVAVQDQPGIVASARSPCDSFRMPRGIDVKYDAIAGSGQIIAIPIDINDDGRGAAVLPFGAPLRCNAQRAAVTAWRWRRRRIDDLERAGVAERARVGRHVATIIVGAAGAIHHSDGVGLVADIGWYDDIIETQRVPDLVKRDLAPVSIIPGNVWIITDSDAIGSCIETGVSGCR